VQTLAPAEQSSRKHPGGIYDQQFVAAEEFGKSREAAVLPSARGAIQQQEARLVTALERALSDAVGRKEVIEIFEVH